MLLTVDHLTRYAYDIPVRAVVQSHRLTPARFDGQRVLGWTVTVSGGEMGGAFRDGAGDWVQGWTVKGPVSAIEVRVQGQVLLQALQEMQVPKLQVRQLQLEHLLLHEPGDEQS